MAVWLSENLFWSLLLIVKMNLKQRRGAMIHRIKAQACCVGKPLVRKQDPDF